MKYKPEHSTLAKIWGRTGENAVFPVPPSLTTSIARTEHTRGSSCTFASCPVPFAMVLRIFNVSLLALAVFCCIDTVAGFRAAHLPLSAQQQSARCTPLQLCTTPPARVARARPWLAVFVASSVIAMPTLALASVTSAGEHLHLGQKIALFFKRALACCPRHVHMWRGRAL